MSFREKRCLCRSYCDRESEKTSHGSAQSGIHFKDSFLINVIKRLRLWWHTSVEISFLHGSFLSSGKPQGCYCIWSLTTAFFLGLIHSHGLDGLLKTTLLCNRTEDNVDVLCFVLVSDILVNGLVALWLLPRCVLCLGLATSGAHLCHTAADLFSAVNLVSCKYRLLLLYSMLFFSSCSGDCAFTLGVFQRVDGLKSLRSLCAVVKLRPTTALIIRASIHHSKCLSQLPLSLQYYEVNTWRCCDLH